MKKVLLSICALVIATVAFAQSNLVNMPNDNLTKGYSTMSTTPNFTPSSLSAAPATIWSDDCSSASTWVFTNSSTLNIDWAIETDPNATPAGGALTPMASASAANGFMMVSAFQSYVIIYYVFGGDQALGAEYVGWAGTVSFVATSVAIFIVTKLYCGQRWLLHPALPFQID